MKKSILYLAAVGISFSANAQLIDESKVPQTVKNTFSKQHPGVTPQWEFEDEKFDAEFKESGKKREILYDRRGNSTEKIDIDMVPAEMKSYIVSHFAGNKIKKAKKLVSANDEVGYLAFVGDKKLHFDSNGKYLGEMKD